MISYYAYLCENCRYPSRVKAHIWNCPGCGKEVCESCFDRLAHCKPCAEGKTDNQLKVIANKEGWDFYD